MIQSRKAPGEANLSGSFSILSTEDEPEEKRGQNVKRSLRACLWLLPALLLGGCVMRPASDGFKVPRPTATPVPAPAGPETDIEQLLANMTLREKVGQLFIVTPDALDPGQAAAAELSGESKSVTRMSRTLGNRLVRYPVGGVVLFGKNIVSPGHLETFLEELQRASKTPLLTAVDEEGGTVSRLAAESVFSLPRYPSAMAVGREGEAAAAEMGHTIGAYLRRYGFTMDFAPVADVATNPENPIIGERAFSSDAGKAAALSGAMAEGLRAEGIIPVYKHFPGHGDTAEDSHARTAVSGKTLGELRECEWLPYLRNDLSGCAVMVGHIALPSVTGDMTPASLSERIVGGLLRGELGFDGAVITDALSMESVRERGEPGTTALAALRAGCDMLLMPADLPAAYDAVLAAVESGSIPESRLDESVRRILRLKASVGLI